MPNEPPENREESPPLNGLGITNASEPATDADAGTAHAGPRRIGQRILIGVVVGLVVFGLTVVAAWLSGRSAHMITAKQFYTQLSLHQFDDLMAQFKSEHGRLPKSIAELGTLDQSSLAFDKNQDILDKWGRPFMYTVDGDKYLVLSYGRDGKPGGDGLDCDLSSDDICPARAQVPLRQFLFDVPSGGMVQVCAITGFFAFLLSLVVIKSADVCRAQAMVVAAKAVLMMSAAVVISVIIVMLHFVAAGH